MKALSIFACVCALAGCGMYGEGASTASAAGYGAKSAATAAPAMTRDGILVGANGMTLYTFDKDPAGAGKSACNGACATNWPPLRAETGTRSSGDWTVITRDDGSTQWAFKGKPLYHWIKDQKPGDRTGDGFNGVWRVARP